MATKGDDCYFFYYSTCTKGDLCPFRHCTEALGNETMCKLWKEGRCFRAATCRFRHMEIQKDRSQIECYWETQPGGCRKPHCVFKHSARSGAGGVQDAKPAAALPEPLMTSSPDPVVAAGRIGGGAAGRGGGPAAGAAPPPAGTRPGPAAPLESSIPSPRVEPVVFNPFEEDSDRESLGVASPAKPPPRLASGAGAKIGRIRINKPEPEETSGLNFAVKSLDELKSEKIARAKQILYEAAQLVNPKPATSQPEDNTASQGTEGSDLVSSSEGGSSGKDSSQASALSSPGRVSAVQRLGGAVRAASPPPAPREQPAGTARRVVDREHEDKRSSAGDSEEEELEMEPPKEKRIAVLKEDLEEGTPAAPPKAVSRRVNLNKGRRIIIADDEVRSAPSAGGAEKQRAPVKRAVVSRSPERADPKRRVKARLGGDKRGGESDAAPRGGGGVKSRLGVAAGRGGESPKRNVLRRLGTRGGGERDADTPSPTEATSLGDLPGNDVRLNLEVRKLEREREELAARLRQLESAESDDEAEERDRGSAEPRRRNRTTSDGSLDLDAHKQKPSSGGVVVKSLEDIQREKALESMKLNRLKKQGANQSAEDEEYGHEEEPIREEEPARREPESPRPIRAKKTESTSRRRAGKQEMQLYKPPGAKRSEPEAGSVRQRLGKVSSERADRKERTERVDRTERTERVSRAERTERVSRAERTERVERAGREERAGATVKSRLGLQQQKQPQQEKQRDEDAENSPRKRTGWGVKTFSEIMREKQLQRINQRGGSRVKQSNSNSREDRSDRPRKNQEPFATDESFNNTDKKRKFTPVVFDLKEDDEGDSEAMRTKPKSVVAKKFKSTEEDKSDAPSVTSRVRSRVSKGDKGDVDKGAPRESHRKRLSRQQSSPQRQQDDVVTSTTPTPPPGGSSSSPSAGRPRKLKRRSSQLSPGDGENAASAEDAGSAGKSRRRSSAASNASARNSAVAPRKSVSVDDTLDLLGDEFGELLGDVDLNSSVVQIHADDDDLLQEMEELLA